MRVEVPLLKRCCFCLPLRYGLLVWSYFTLVIYILFLVDTLLYATHVFAYGEWIPIVNWAVCTLALTSNFAVTLLVIVAAHKKSVQLLRMCVLGGLSAVGVNVVQLLWYTLCYAISFRFTWRNWYWMFWFVLGILAYNGVQLYVIALVRSEIVKLKNNHSYEFQNLAVQVERGYYEPETMKIDEQAPETVNVDEKMETNNFEKQTLVNGQV